MTFLTALVFFVVGMVLGAPVFLALLGIWVGRRYDATQAFLRPIVRQLKANRDETLMLESERVREAVLCQQCECPLCGWDHAPPRPMYSREEMELSERWNRDGIM